MLFDRILNLPLVQRRSSRNMIYAVNPDAMDGLMVLLTPLIAPESALLSQPSNVVGN